ncbi:MAG: tripartite tricarboxylate transporter substrate binding protein [Betaproteobacteria bacterium]
MVPRHPEVARLAVAALLAIASMWAGAQAPYPTRAVRIIVPYAPGALTDVLARTIGQRLSVAMGQPFVVENRPGAGTLTGAEVVARSAPDGYTLLMATSTTLGISPALYATSPIDPLKDFAPVSQVGTVNFFLIANPSFPARNVKEMIETLRRSPGKYNYASVGSGSPHHLFMEILKHEYDLDVQHVAYKGTPAALADLIAGRIDFMFADATVAVPNIVAGKVVALGTSAAKPTALMKNVPPIAATVSDFDWQAWQGIVAPAGTPQDIVERLWRELRTIEDSPQFRDDLVKFGMEPLPSRTPAEFAAAVASELPRWATIVKTSGARVD